MNISVFNEDITGTLNPSRVMEVFWPTLLSLTKADTFILTIRSPGQSIHHSVSNLLNLQGVTITIQIRRERQRYLNMRTF